MPLPINHSVELFCDRNMAALWINSKLSTKPDESHRLYCLPKFVILRPLDMR